jgi:peptide/nickel transport system permease protein
VTSYIVRRLLQAIPTFLGITIIAYTIIRLAPGDPLTVFEDARGTTAEQMAELRKAYGFDRPLPVQYAEWLGRAVRLDFGRSFQTHLPAKDLILERIPATLQLTVTALLIGLLVGIPAGMWAAVHRRGWPDQLVRVFAVTGDAVPHFWLGQLTIILFAVMLGWLPAGGITTLGAPNSGDFVDRLKHLLLPALVLATGFLAVFARYMRTEVLEVLNQDYIRTARAKGLRETVVLYGHALRNALIPIITVLGGSLPALLAGAATTEFVFSWPGMARLAVDAAYARDYPVVMGLVLVASALIIFGNIVSDVLYGVADPRIRLR